MKRIHQYVKSMIRVYIAALFLYISLEVVILNVLNAANHSLIPIFRYGIELAGYVLLFFACLFREKQTIRLNFYEILVLLTMMTGIVSSAAHSVKPIVFLIGFRYFFRYWYAYMLILLGGYTMRHIRQFWKLFRNVMGLEMLLSCWQILHRPSSELLLYPHYGSITDSFGGKINAVTSKLAIYGSFGRYNLFSYFAIAALWYWIAKQEFQKHGKNRRNLVLWAILLIFSYSRQAIVSLLATYMMYLYFRKSAKATWKYLLWGTVPLLVLIIAGQRFVLPRNYLTTGIGNVQGSIWERYVSMFSFDFLREDYKGHGRTWFLTEGLKRILEVHPFLGFGIGMYGCPDTTFIDDSAYMTLGISTQSYYMDVYIGCIIGQIGIIGFVCYMCSFIVVFRKCFHIINSRKTSKEYKMLSLITCGTVLTAIFMTAFSSSLSNRIMALYMHLFIGFLMSVSRTSHRSEKYVLL